MVKESYIPERGDVVWTNFSPRRGHEQGGKRPAVVLSPRVYNERTKLAVVCPVTSLAKSYPFEVLLSENKISGVILVDQIRVFDWQARKFSFIDTINKKTLNEVQGKLVQLIIGS